jgi:predicted permease
MSLIRRVANLFRSSRVAREIDAELAAHIAMRIDDNLAVGMAPAEAKRDALLRFGNPVVTQERVAVADTDRLLAGLGRDLHYALRQLRRSPGFAITAVITLALGIGANVVVLGVLQALVLRPLDVPNAERLFSIVQKTDGGSQSYPDYLDYRARNTAFTDLMVFRPGRVGLAVGSNAAKQWDYEVSGNYFDALSIQPALGRFFHASDEHGPDSAPYIVLSDGFWRSRFHADPAVVGSTVTLNKHPFTILGVAPASFHGTVLFFWPDFWMPMVNEQQVEGYDFLHNRGSHGLAILGLLKPGVTLEQATSNLNTVAAQMARENPTLDDGLGARIARPGLPGDDRLERALRAFLFGILLLALLVLLAACVNLGSIFAARASDRSRELSIRLAIGSSRWHILRQLLTEALVVSLGGGLVGSAVATLLLRLLTHWQPFANIPVRVVVAADARVYALSLALSLGSGLLFGLLPAGQVWRTDAARVMRGAPPPLLRRFSLRDVLLATQIALCTLLVTASLVAMRGMQRSLHAPLGLVPQNVTLAATDLHMAGYKDADAPALEHRMADQARNIPGVTAAGIINDPPLGEGGSSTPIYREATNDFRYSNSVATAHYYSISPGYLAAAGTRLLEGRDFSWQDDANAPAVALVNETLARKMFGNASALGQHFRTMGSKYEIVGVVEDGKYDSLTEDPAAALFYPLSQEKDAIATLVLRSALPEADAAGAAHRLLTGIDPGLPVSISSWTRALDVVLFPAHVAAACLGVMGLLAAMLAVTGTFGMAAYSVSKRMRELGIRVALGAQRLQMLRSAPGRPVGLLVAGSGIGLLLGMLTSRLLAAIVYQATSRDPLVLGGAVATMILLGALATWIPARRAFSVEPARLLRDE